MWNSNKSLGAPAVCYPSDVTTQKILKCYFNAVILVWNIILTVNCQTVIIISSNVGITSPSLALLDPCHAQKQNSEHHMHVRV